MGWWGSGSVTTASAAPTQPRLGWWPEGPVAGTGGTLPLESRPGQGNRLLVELPIDAGQPPEANWRTPTCKRASS